MVDVTGHEELLSLTTVESCHGSLGVVLGEKSKGKKVSLALTKGGRCHGS